MEFQWILLALFLVAVISGMSKALSKSMLKNTLRLGSVVVAFLITFVMQLCGVFQNVVTEIINLINLASMLPGFEGAADLISGLASTLVSPIFFIIVFFPILWVLRIVVHFVVKGIDRMNEKKAAALEQAPAETAAPVAEENTETAEESAEATEKTDEATEESAALTTDDGAELTAEECADVAEEDAPEAEVAPAVENAESVSEVEEKPKKKKKKKSVFYEECAWKRAVSIASGAISGLLVLAVFMMPFFYLMSVVSSATDAIEGSDADDSQIYKVVDVVDEYIVDPYEESFVSGFYDTVALSDLMNYTTRAGGKIVLDNGEVVYADDVLKGLLSHGVSIAAQITSAKSECNTIRNDVEAIVSDPMISSILADVVMYLIADVEVEEPAEDDLIGGLTVNFIEYYKNADKATVSKDLKSLGGAIGVLAEERVLAALLSGNADFESMLSDEETLGDVVEAISGLSVFGPTLEGAFELGVEILGETLQIPADDADVYENFMDDLLTQMVKDNSTKFDINTIRYYVYNCAVQGVKVSSTNGISGHSQFVAYVAHWEKVQSAFAHASEDKSYGYFTIEINGEWYVYDKNNKDIVIYSSENESEYKDKISPIAGLINALTLRSTTKQLTRENLYTILNAYVDSSSDEVSLELANRILAKESFTSDAVTIEKMLASVDFTDWTEEEKASDSRLCVNIITKLLGLMESLGTLDASEGVEGAMDMIDQFELLGETMDNMKQTSCIKNLPPLLIEGIVKNEMFADFMKPSIAFQINDIVENNDKTYAECMNQIAGVLKWAINSIGGEI